MSSTLDTDVDGEDMDITWEPNEQYTQNELQGKLESAGFRPAQQDDIYAIKDVQGYKAEASLDDNSIDIHVGLDDETSIEEAMDVKEEIAGYFTDLEDETGITEETAERFLGDWEYEEADPVK